MRVTSKDFNITFRPDTVWTKDDVRTFNRQYEKLAVELRGELLEAGNRASLDEIKKAASNNEAAKNEAEAALALIREMVLDLSDEAQILLISRFAELREIGTDTLHSMANKPNLQTRSKSDILEEYRNLRAAQTLWAEYIRVWLDIPVATIPPLQGNYKDKETNYYFTVDGVTTMNPFSAAKAVGITVSGLTEAVSIFTKKVEINGHKVGLDRR